MSNPNTPAIDPTGPVVQVTVMASKYDQLQAKAVAEAMEVLGQGIYVASFIGEPAKVNKHGGITIVTATLQVGRPLS